MNCLTVPDFIAYRFEDRQRLALKLCRRIWGVKEASWTIRCMDDLLSAEKAGSMPIFECFDPDARRG